MPDCCRICLYWMRTFSIRSVDMNQPSHSALSKQRVPTGKIITILDISVGHFVLQEYAQDTTDACHVEAVEYYLLSGVCVAYVLLPYSSGVCPHSSLQTSKS